MTARAWYTAGRLVDWRCPRCGCNSLTMTDGCPAKISDLCPGFERTEEVHREFEDNYETLKGGKLYG